MKLRHLALAGATLVVSAAGASSAFGAAGPVERFGRVYAANVCARVATPGVAHCHAKVVTDARGNIIDGHPNALSPHALPSGNGPANIHGAYGLGAVATSGAGTGPTVAIVDAYGYTNLASDLATYRSTYGLPPCTVASGCLKIVNQNGGSQLPRMDTGWAQETALDVDMVSATCPTCKILVVQASSNSMANLGTAVNTAAQMGAVAISNSYGGSEYSGETTDEVNYYKHQNIAVTVSSGDNGYGAEFPAASQYVTAVGGTSLYNTNGTYTEAAWNGAGSGCSAYEPKPAWQTDSLCGKRTIADVSAVADPNTGVAVYGPYTRSTSRWMVFGGTSASSPIIASVFARAGGTTNYGSDPWYQKTSSNLRDVASGSNGSCTTALCKSGVGYDGPTGLGSPIGLSAF